MATWTPRPWSPLHQRKLRLDLWLKLWEEKVGQAVQRRVICSHNQTRKCHRHKGVEGPRVCVGMAWFVFFLCGVFEMSSNQYCYIY